MTSKALKTARLALLISLGIWAVMIASSTSNRMENELIYVTAIFAGVAMGISAIACVVLQALSSANRRPRIPANSS
ncbi:MAG: hypothetical protein J7500_18515 [Sphingomonas sp.]|uniref:hypothetical protein n=1 Tax=Sphingomonas sp. TaxID=28214 RepID=UPI001B04F3C8|nr:hypothetical protein [Sphingomonas sp.]MBO9624705.1 hypothetical protein [Sphingomonas sp.]